MFCTNTGKWTFISYPPQRLCAKKWSISIFVVIRLLVAGSKLPLDIHFVAPRYEIFNVLRNIRVTWSVVDATLRTHCITSIFQQINSHGRQLVNRKHWYVYIYIVIFLVDYSDLYLDIHFGAPRHEIFNVPRNIGIAWRVVDAVLRNSRITSLSILTKSTSCGSFRRPPPRYLLDTPWQHIPSPCIRVTWSAIDAALQRSRITSSSIFQKKLLHRVGISSTVWIYLVVHTNPRCFLRGEDP